MSFSVIAIFIIYSVFCAFCGVFFVRSWNKFRYKGTFRNDKDN